MQYNIIEQAEVGKEECLVVGVFEDTATGKQLQGIPKTIEKNIEKLLTRLCKKSPCLWQIHGDGPSLLLVLLGKQTEVNADSFQKKVKCIAECLKKQNFEKVSICLPDIEALSSEKQLELTIRTLDENFFQLLDFKEKPDDESYALKQISIVSQKVSPAALTTALAVIKGIRVARRLANLPANICTPDYLAGVAQQMAKEHKKIKSKIHNKSAIEKIGMHSFLSVAQGSNEEPRFIELHYQGTDSKTAPVVLVGKGITFDAGGISLKPANGMEDMKFDMGGAASVFGAVKACAELDLPVNLIGLVPAAENLPGGKALKPGDVIGSLSGQSIEVVNTDAEGRLILADALTYSERFKPEFVIDLATLTGAMVVALGDVYSGYFTSDEAIADKISEAAKSSMDKAWRMPMDEAYQSNLDSLIADMANSRFGGSAGSIVAACFLSRFTKNLRWAHMDIAGSAWGVSKSKLATGRPVALLTELLRLHCHAD